MAFYADCEHEVNRVQRGRRICLAYNLFLKKSQKKSASEMVSSASEMLARSISQFVTTQPREPLVFAFEHHYTQKGLQRELIKGADRELADLVAAAAEQAKNDPHWDWSAHCAPAIEFDQRIAW